MKKIDKIKHLEVARVCAIHARELMELVREKMESAEFISAGVREVEERILSITSDIVRIQHRIEGA